MFCKSVIYYTSSESPNLSLSLLLITIYLIFGEKKNTFSESLLLTMEHFCINPYNISIFVNTATTSLLYKCNVILSVFQGEHACHPLYVDQFHQSEADIMDVPELHWKPGAPVNGFVSQENVPFVFAQTPKGYYNQPLKKYTSPSLILPTTAIPSQSELSPSSFTSVFPNLSYNLIMQIGGQQSNSELELQEGSSLERSSSGYQPQGHTKTFTLNQTEEIPDSPVSCVSTYILLPQSPST